MNRKNTDSYAFLSNILVEQDVQPVLIDIGATGKPPEIWCAISSNAIYIGFDPDPRATVDNIDVFFEKHLVPKAVTPIRGTPDISLFMTRTPACSSTLLPDHESLDNYLEGSAFEVEKNISVPACTLNDVISDMSLTGPKWIKTDSQGTDLRIFNSLKPEYRQTVMALDVEPGLINAYQGEDLFVDTHKDLLAQGFWMSDIQIHGFPRVNSLSQDYLREHKNLNKNDIALYLRKSPCWCEVRYLRSLDFMLNNSAEKKDYLCLWAFAMLDKQPGFALDILMACERKYGADSVYAEAMQITIHVITDLEKRHKGFLEKALRLLPARWRARCGDLLDASLTAFRDRIVAQCREAAENPHLFGKNV